jgi:pimeloyl-ACP methyl ester carboxylesterase
VFLNRFAEDEQPLDMTATDEFRSLLSSAADLGIPHAAETAYRSRNVVLRHHRFHFLEWGPADAPAIVLLHGGHQSAHSWDLVSLSLARRFRVLALDQRGHGDSEWARDVDYSNHTMSVDAEAFIAALGLERPVLVGHSMGGRNALLLARRNPGCLRALVVVDIGPEISEKGRQSIAGFVRANEEFDDLEAFIANVQKYDPYRPRAHIERTVKYNMLQRPDGKYISKCDPAPRRLGLLAGRRAQDNLALSELGELDLPVLIVRGANSNILEADAAERFRDALTHGTLVTVPDCGHGVPSQNTLGFLAALVGYLDSNG